MKLACFARTMAHGPDRQRPCRPPYPPDRPARCDRHRLEQLSPRDRAAEPGPLPPRRLPERNRAARRRPRRQRPADRRGGGTRPGLPGPFCAAPAGLCTEPGACGGDADVARGAQSRRVPGARPASARAADRSDLGARGSAPDLCRRRAPAAVRRAASGRRHRRPLDRDDHRRRPQAAARRVVPGRQREPVDEVLRRGPVHRVGLSPGPGGGRRRARRSARTVRRHALARGARFIGHGRCGLAVAGCQWHHRRPHHAGRAALADGTMPARRPGRQARARRLERRPARGDLRRSRHSLHACRQFRHRRIVAGPAHCARA